MKKTKKSKRIKREYNLEEGILIMDDIEYPFTGLDPTVSMKLAMIGAGSLLCKTDKPLVLWEKIRQNRFGQRREYKNMPKIIYAYAHVYNISIEKAVREWSAYTRAEKIAIKKQIDIKKALLLIEFEKLNTINID